MSRHEFETSVTVEHIQDLPLKSGFLFAKTKLKSGKFSHVTPSKEVINHKVDWHDTFELKCSFKTDGGRLTDKILRISIRKETKGGKDSEKIGYCDINLGERAAYSLPCQGRYPLKSKKSKALAGNSILVVTTAMVQVLGDPIFKTVEIKQIKILTETDSRTNSDRAGVMITGRDKSDSSDDDSAKTGKLSKSPSQSIDHVSIGDSSSTHPNDILYTQSLDRKDWRSKPLLNNLRTKSYSGSINNISDPRSSLVRVGSNESNLQVDNKAKSPHYRQDSGLGCSQDEPFE